MTKYRPVYTTEPRLSTVLRKNKCLEQRITVLHPGDIVIRKKAVKSIIQEIARLEDGTYAYLATRRDKP